MISSIKIRSVCQRPTWGAVSSTCRVIVIARVSATARKTPPATPRRSRIRQRIKTATTTALVHHARRNEISTRQRQSLREDEQAGAAAVQRQQRQQYGDQRGPG